MSAPRLPRTPRDNALTDQPPSPEISLLLLSAAPPGAAFFWVDTLYNAFQAMSRRTLTLAGNALFVFYCTAVGVYLLLRPWSSRHIGLPSSGFFRGFVSGLGLIHLVAGWSDLRVLSRALGPPPSEPG